MERILAVSDTHGKIDNIIKLMENVPFTQVLHLGDLVRDAIALEKAFPKVNFTYVRGNNDTYGPPDEALVTISGKKIFLCHGHKYSVSSSLLSLSLRAEEKGASLALFGHTHRKTNEEYNGIILFNPGSSSLSRDGCPSVGIIEIDEDYFGIAHYDF